MLPRTRGALIVAASALRWSPALTPDPEAVRMANGTGEAAWGAGARAMQAIIAAFRGQADLAAALAVEAEGSAASTGATHMLAYVHVARGLAALGDGRADDAYDEFVRIYDSDDPAHHPVPSCWYVGELAEAAAHCGRADEARV